jgi:hypothetical protein
LSAVASHATRSSAGAGGLTGALRTSAGAEAGVAAQLAALLEKPVSAINKAAVSSLRQFLPFHMGFLLRSRLRFQCCLQVFRVVASLVKGYLVRGQIRPRSVKALFLDFEHKNEYRSYGKQNRYGNQQELEHHLNPMLPVELGDEPLRAPKMLPAIIDRSMVPNIATMKMATFNTASMSNAGETVALSSSPPTAMMTANIFDPNDRGLPFSSK